MDLIDELKRLITRLDEKRIEYALCGGLAMAVYALPRATLDIDIMVEASSLHKTKQAVHDLGFILDAMPMEFHGGKVNIHRVTTNRSRHWRDPCSGLAHRDVRDKGGLGKSHEGRMGGRYPQRCLARRFGSSEVLPQEWPGSRRYSIPQGYYG